MNISAMDPASFCWRTIGTEGDHSCPQLAAQIHCRNCPQYSALGRSLFDRPMPAGYRQEASAEMAALKSSGRDQTFSVLVFRLASEWFALRSVAFHEVAEDQRPYRLPFRSGNHLSGLANVNGELLLYISLERLLGLLADAPSPPGRPRLCVVAGGRERYAFRVQEILGVRRVPISLLQDAPATVLKSPSALTSSCFEWEGRTVGLLDERRLFDSLDRSLRW